MWMAFEDLRPLPSQPTERAAAVAELLLVCDVNWHHKNLVSTIILAIDTHILTQIILEIDITSLIYHSFWALDITQRQSQLRHWAAGPAMEITRADTGSGSSGIPATAILDPRWCMQGAAEQGARRLPLAGDRWCPRKWRSYRTCAVCVQQRQGRRAPWICRRLVEFAVVAARKDMPWLVNWSSVQLLASASGGSSDGWIGPSIETGHYAVVICFVVSNK
jgi:hypothetical protein